LQTCFRIQHQKPRCMNYRAAPLSGVDVVACK
jgi:hypothetical protein